MSRILCTGVKEDGGGGGQGDVLGRVNVSVDGLYTGCDERRGWGGREQRNPSKRVLMFIFCFVCSK